MDYYPDNTLAHYFTKLPQTINLDEGAWDVMLVEMQYPHTWFNGSMSEKEKCGLQSPRAPSIRRIMLQGLYNTAEDLIEQLNAMSGERSPIVFRYNKWTQKAQIVVRGGSSIQLSPTLQHILGFKLAHYSNTGHSKTMRTAVADRTVDVKDGFYSLYVYCNLLTPRPVGDTMVPLLRIVPVKGTYGEEISKTYENVHYHPIQQKRFDTVEMDIRDDTGRPVPFERGKVVVTLHFKKRRSPLFD